MRALFVLCEESYLMSKSASSAVGMGGLSARRKRTKTSDVGAESIPLAAKIRQKVDDACRRNSAADDIETCHLQWRPLHWQQVYENIRRMRVSRDAPVDSLGAESFLQCGFEPAIERLHVLVSLMLSSQTKDQVNHAAMDRLKSLPGGLTVQTLLDIDVEVLMKTIYPVGFYKRKAGYLKKMAAVSRTSYGDDIPPTAVALKQLSGVGPKMAHLCMSIAWNQVTGIGVDTHVHRICNRLGWLEKPTKTPEATEIALQSWMPSDRWKEVNLMLVGFGQQTCTPLNPRCRQCLNSQLCPAAVSV